MPFLLQKRPQNSVFIEEDIAEPPRKKKRSQHSVHVVVDSSKNAKFTQPKPFLNPKVFNFIFNNCFQLKTKDLSAVWYWFVSVFYRNFQEMVDSLKKIWSHLFWKWNDHKTLMLLLQAKNPKLRKKNQLSFQRYAIFFSFIIWIQK